MDLGELGGDGDGGSTHGVGVLSVDDLVLIDGRTIDLDGCQSLSGSGNGGDDELGALDEVVSALDGGSVLESDREDILVVGGRGDRHLVRGSERDLDGDVRGRHGERIGSVGVLGIAHGLVSVLDLDRVDAVLDVLGGIVISDGGEGDLLVFGNVVRGNGDGSVRIFRFVLDTERLLEHDVEGGVSRDGVRRGLDAICPIGELQLLAIDRDGVDDERPVFVRRGSQGDGDLGSGDGGVRVDCGGALRLVVDIDGDVEELLHVGVERDVAGDLGLFTVCSSAGSIRVPSAEGISSLLGYEAGSREFFVILQAADDLPVLNDSSVPSDVGHLEVGGVGSDGDSAELLDIMVRHGEGEDSVLGIDPLAVDSDVVDLPSFIRDGGHDDGLTHGVGRVSC